MGVEKLTMVSTNTEQDTVLDSEYVYVDSGEAFRRSHARAFADSNTSKITIASALWAKNHLLSFGGTAYLPMHLIVEELNKTLFPVLHAPVFSRDINLVVNEEASRSWNWFEDILIYLQKRLR